MTHAVVGYPSLEANWTMLERTAEAGVDLVELQLPFSEPIADGPSFIRANQGALDQSVGWKEYFELVARATESFPFRVLFMGYYNSVYRMGAETFCARLREAGASGFIVADLPPEEARDLNEEARGAGLDPVLLMTPTNSDERLRAIAALASGFVYCVARKGVTGRRTDVGSDVRAFLARCRSATDLPLALGFGIKTPGDIAAVADAGADIAIVGTACLEAWERGGEGEYASFLRSLTAP